MQHEVIDAKGFRRSSEALLPRTGVFMGGTSHGNTGVLGAGIHMIGSGKPGSEGGGGKGGKSVVSVRATQPGGEPQEGSVN